jgi:Smg protein
MLAALREQFAPDTDVGELERFLLGEGLDGQEIGEVLSLYFAEDDGAAASAETGPTSLRVQGPHERGRFTTEAWGHLVALRASRVVSVHDFEQLVERALILMDGRIGLAEIRALADELGLDAATHAADRTVLH